MPKIYLKSKTFNMGWGFAIIVQRKDVNTIVNSLKEGEIIGRVTDSKEIIIHYKNKRIIL